MMKDITEQLKLHEGFSKYPYEDTTGHITIGYGTNLEARGISKELATRWLNEDIADTVQKLKKHPWFWDLDEIRKKVIIDMGYNLGVPGLMSFQLMIEAIKEKDYEKAAKEMEDSLWHDQVKERAPRLEKMMRTGKDYES